YAHVVAGAPVVDPADAALFRAPANAIASRHPFLDCRWVAPRPQIEPDGLLAPGAGFRRAVPEVRIALPGLALPLTVIGVHLKAKGHGADRAAAAAMPDWDGRFRDYLRRRSAGMAGQAIRRAAEAMMLYDRAMAIVAADPAAPVAVMGDFNDDPDSMVMRSLTNNAETGQIALPDPSPEDRRAFFRWQLYDAGRLVFGAARVPTHFSAAHGASVLDTVLVSNALNGSNTRGLARPVAAGVLTDLVAGQPDARRASDHAPVFVRFATRSEAEP
ncbi:MAG: endonuclease/exonuclease/phosphatase family protein, partial [Gemmobacter sp.]